MELTEKELEKFIAITCRCFQKLAPEFSAIVPEEPTIQVNDSVFLDFTGVIDLHQKGKHGKIYLTMPEGMINDVLQAIGEDKRDQEIQRDLIGELASTVCSNAREHFGSTLAISLPTSLNRFESLKLSLAPMRFVLPLKLKKYTSYLVIALGNSDKKKS
ncbi:MAG: chemotaxis protein CheX [Verrucomicrobiota bacterium]